MEKKLKKISNTSRNSKQLATKQTCYFLESKLPYQRAFLWKMSVLHGYIFDIIHLLYQRISQCNK